MRSKIPQFLTVLVRFRISFLPKTVREILALRRKEILKRTKTVKNCGIVDEIKNPDFTNFHSSTHHNISNTNVVYSSSTSFHSRIADSRTSNDGEKLEDINHIFKSTNDLFSHQATDSWLQTTAVDLKTTAYYGNIKSTNDLSVNSSPRSSVLPSIANSSNDDTSWPGSIDQVLDSSSFNKFEVDTYGFLIYNSDG